MTKEILGGLALAAVAALGASPPVGGRSQAFGFGESESRKGGGPDAHQ